MVASASVWCRGSPCSTSASGTSPASPCQAAELTGRSHGREGWGCERRASLACLKPSRPDQRHPVKAGASRAPASRLAAMTGCRRPGRGLLKQVRLDGKRNASDSGRGIALVANDGPLHVDFDCVSDHLRFECVIKVDHTPENAPDFRIEDYARKT